MPAGAAPGSCWHACRIERTTPDPLRAMPVYVPRPLSAPGSAFADAQRIFPRRSGAYEACRDTPPRLDGPWDYRRPDPDNDVEVPQLWALAARRRSPQGSLRAASYHGRWLRPW